MKITADQARRLILSSQMLCHSPGSLKNSLEVERIIRNLGYVQIDTISVVKRAHHHTFWTRFKGYHPDMLHKLQAVDRKIFEYWGHAASYLPMSDYRFYTRRMMNFNDPMDKWARNRFEKCGHLMDGILDRIDREGPLGSRDFKSNPGAGPGQWWDWKPAKIALELLFWKGDLMITRRDNFQRIYDLTERVLPDGTDTSVPDTDELGRFLVHRALKAQGISTMNDIVKHIHAADREVIEDAARSMLDQEEILSVAVAGEKDHYILSESLAEIPSSSGDSSRVHILSPFDNLVILRDRISRLFNFDYTLECYTPAVKRRFGYFVLPVLWGTEFAARLDSKADRKKGILILRSLLFEEGFAGFETFLPAFSRKLADFAAFNGCSSITIENVKPGKIKAPLKKMLTG